MADGRAYTYSQLSAESAQEFVASNYEAVEPLSCKYYMLGLHDNYLVRGCDGRYILRIYRSDWRNVDEVAFELELLTYLRAKNAPVAWPLPTVDGRLAFSIDSPEGERMAALLPYAEGRAPEDEITTDQCESLGHAVALVHELSDGFSTSHHRPELDFPHLVEESIERIKPFLDSEGVLYVDGLHARLHKHWPKLAKESGVFGICHGDVNPRNFHLSGSPNVTLFDFDQCGFGYRAFDIGKFASSLQPNAQKRALVDAFIQGYRKCRRLSESECASISYFEVVAVLWVMSIRVKNANRIGHKYFEKPYWDAKLKMLRELESERA